MSQIWLRGGSLPPGSDIQSITPDYDISGGPGVPVGPDASFNINLLTGVGLTSVGNAATSTIVISLDNDIEGTGTTVGAGTADLITLDLGTTPGTYLFRVDIVGFDALTPLGCAYFLKAAARTTGAVGIEIKNETADEMEEGVLSGCDNDFLCVGNSGVIRVTGVAGKTINWKAVMTYTFKG
jgi:hypothetical protein